MIRSATMRRSVSIPVSRWRVGCTRLVSIGQQRPGQSTREIDPDAGASEAGLADGFLRAGVAARPSFVTRLPPKTACCRLACTEFGEPRIDALQKALRRVVEDPVDRTEKTCMASGAA